MGLKESSIKAARNIDKIRIIMLAITIIVFVAYLVWAFIEDWQVTLMLLFLIVVFIVVVLLLIVFVCVPIYLRWEHRSLKRALRKMVQSSEDLLAASQQLAESLGVTDEDDDQKK